MFLLNNKAGATLLVLIMLASFGFRRLINKPVVRAYSTQHSANVAAERTVSASGRVSVRPGGASEDLFEHFQPGNGAAELVALQSLNSSGNSSGNSSEWLASFHAPVQKGQKASALRREERGWFEKEEAETSETLPLVKSYRGLGGDLRIEDAGSGATLFSYQASAAFKPVAVVKAYEMTGTTWQIVFSNQSGMLSQTASR
ncbi:MAG: hypothetical protein HOP19_06255 [Acidobacteria bacterium]|nr:hypothetical protein [Acidobacteriota bacterium]